MSNRRIQALVVAVVLLSVATFVLVGYLRHPRPSFAETVQFIRALDKFVVSREQRGQSRPASVELHELVDSGLVTAMDAHRFEGSTITFEQANRSSSPQIPFDSAQEVTMIRVQLRDGRVMVMSMDGSISQLPR